MSRAFPFGLTRRGFLSQLSICLTMPWVPAKRLFGVTSQAANPSAPARSEVVRSRAPLAASVFYPLPLGSIRPEGWLLQQLRIQANGLGGHLDETWADVGPNSGWLGGTGESWERGPYFLDGLIPLAYLLDDPGLKAKAQKYVDWTLEHQQANGMIGPASNDDWWPRFVMLKALTQFQELSGDPRVIPVMDRYFRHQLQALPTRPLQDWGKFRWQDELLSVLWLYNRTGSSYLIDLAKLLKQQGHDWQAQYADFKYTQRVTAEYIKLEEGGGLKDLALSTHGVNNGQAVKAGPVWSIVSGNSNDRSAVFKMISELDKYHGLPNGMFSCDEHLAGRDPSQGSELCTVVEYMFSLEHAVAITGDPLLGDRLERLAFNALPGTFTEDMWAHQYNQEPNQVECSLHHKPWTTDGPESNIYGLDPNFGCCTANFHQGWPKFANSLFMLSSAKDQTGMEGLVAVAYAPCEVETLIRGTYVYVLEATSYPFQGTVSFTINPEVPLQFPIRFRIPSWARKATLLVNGRAEAAPASGSFAIVERQWQAGDRVELAFPMEPRVSSWFRDSVAIERGPLVFSYGIGESWVKLRNRGMTADWQVFPTTAWNYALSLDAVSPSRSIKVIETEIGQYPFARNHPPLRLSLKARKIDAWLAEDGATDSLPQSPVTSEQPEEIITLIPYAAAKLRITAFPLLTTRSKEVVIPPQPPN